MGLMFFSVPRNCISGDFKFLKTLVAPRFVTDSLAFNKGEEFAKVSPEKVFRTQSAFINSAVDASLLFSKLLLMFLGCLWSTCDDQYLCPLDKAVDLLESVSDGRP